MDSTSITVIKPGQLIDGLGGPPISGAAVVLQENLIHWIGSSEEIETNQEIKNLVDSAGQYGVLDLPQCTLLPGLIDCHSHTNMPGDGRTGEESTHCALLSRVITFDQPSSPYPRAQAGHQEHVRVALVTVCSVASSPTWFASRLRGNR